MVVDVAENADRGKPRPSTQFSLLGLLSAVTAFCVLAAAVAYPEYSPLMLVIVLSWLTAHLLAGWGVNVAEWITSRVGLLRAFKQHSTMSSPEKPFTPKMSNQREALQALKSQEALAIKKYNAALCPPEFVLRCKAVRLLAEIALSREGGSDASIQARHEAPQ